MDFQLKQVLFPEELYLHNLYEKRQIVLHHTVSGEGISGDTGTWINDSRRIATPLIIDRKGIVWQCFYTGKWAYHLGAGNSDLDKHSIGIELDSWGALVEKDGLWFPVDYVGRTNTINESKIHFYKEKYRNFRAFEKYTDAQIDSAVKVIRYLGEKYNIPVKYNENIWGINQRALNGDEGLYTHASYRLDKSDCHPYPKLIKGLQQL